MHFTYIATIEKLDILAECLNLNHATLRNHIGSMYIVDSCSSSTLEYQINVGLRLLNFEPFSQAYALIRYPTFINFPMNYMATDIVRMSCKVYIHIVENVKVHILRF